MKTNFIILLLLFGILFIVDGRKLSRSRSSSSSRRTSYKPQPTSISQQSAAQPAAKPSLFAWQEQPAQAQRKSSPPRQSQPPKQPQTHSYPSSNTGLSGGIPAKPSYPSSNTGLSGNSPAKTPSHQQESIQKSSVPQSASGQYSPSQTNNHGYPSSNTGLSGSGSSSGSGAGYPSNQGHSGAGAPPPYSAAGGSSYHPQGPPPAYSNSGGYPKQQSSGVGAPPPYSGSNYGNNYNHPAPPPAYSPNYGGGYGGYGGHGGYGSHGGSGYSPMNTPQMPGYFGNHGNRGYGGSVGRSSNILTGVGIAGAGVGTILTGLALWNLARSTGQHRHTVIYDNRGQPVAVAPSNSTEPVVDPILGDLVNCTLTISNDNATEVLSIPCAIATSFTPEADVKDAGINNNPNDNTKCTVTVVTKAGREFMTTIPCSTLLNTAAENNVTEPPLINNGTDLMNGTLPAPPDVYMNAPVPLGPLPVSPDAYVNAPVPPTPLPLAGDIKYANLNCTLEPGDVRDPINPCFAVSSDLSAIPLQVNFSSTTSTPPSA